MNKNTPSGKNVNRFGDDAGASKQGPGRSVGLGEADDRKKEINQPDASQNPPSLDDIQEVLTAISNDLKKYIRSLGTRSATAILQETYLSAASAYEKSTCRKPESLEDVPTWLRTIARNNAHNHFRKNRRVVTGVNGFCDSEVDLSPSPFAMLEQRELTKIIAEMTMELTPAERIVLSTLIVPQREAAEQLGCDLDKISHKRRILRTKVQRWLLKHYPDFA